MKILCVAPEVAPMVKIGGLADVVGSLPKQLEKLGHDIRIVCPLYGIITKDESWILHDRTFNVILGHCKLETHVWESFLPNSRVPVYFLEYGPYFDRNYVYDDPSGFYQDNDQRFTFFNRASLNLCQYLDWVPDIIHCHDWTTGLIPIYLNTSDAKTPLGRTATVFTIHNLQHQGVFSSDLIDFAKLPASIFRTNALESNGLVNLLKGGIYHATTITTVSSTYAREIQFSKYGCGLNEAIKFRADDLIGVLNGIDTSIWNPRTDSFLPSQYSQYNLTKKLLSKIALQKKLGLKVNSNAMILGVVSRLYNQKGFDLLATIIPKLISNMNIQIALVGTGETSLQESFRDHTLNYPEKVYAFIGYSDELAHLLMAGSDCLIVPSRFEPCGLTQLYAMNYGTPPIVRRTGGLVDTVDSYLERGEKATGFVFDEPTPDALYDILTLAYSIYFDHPKKFRCLQLNGLKKDFSWEKPSTLYSDIYRWAVKKRRAVFTKRTFHPMD